MHLPPALPLEIDYLAIGHPTIDQGTPQGDVAGGTVLYAAVQAARLGWAAGFVGRADPAELGPLLAPFAGEVSARLQPAARTTRFVNLADGDDRTQWVTAAAAPVDPLDLAAPGARPRARVVHLAPVARELDLVATVAHVEGDTVGVTPQGLIRRWGAEGRVVLVPLAPRDTGDEVAAAIDVVVVAEDERPFVEVLTRAVNARGGLVVTTQGSEGCRVETARGGQAVPALPVVAAVDRTGAGDVFAAALLVGLGEGRAVTDAVRFAMAAASCSIEGVGPAAVAGREAIERRLAAAT